MNSKPPNVPIQAVNCLRTIANAHMRQLQRSLHPSLSYSSCYPLYSAHRFVPSASSHTLVPVQAAFIDAPVREGGVAGSADVETDRSRSQADEGVDSSQRRVESDGPLLEPCGNGPLS
eukprot:4314402-Pleurochrysis_carterae.AAC.1